jgi:hypothetical protein
LTEQLFELEHVVFQRRNFLRYSHKFGVAESSVPHIGTSRSEPDRLLLEDASLHVVRILLLIPLQRSPESLLLILVRSRQSPLDVRREVEPILPELFKVPLVISSGVNRSTSSDCFLSPKLPLTSFSYWGSGAYCEAWRGELIEARSGDAHICSYVVLILLANARLWRQTLIWVSVEE